MEVSGHLHTLAALLGGKELLVPLKRLDWTQSWSGCLEEGRPVFPLPGIAQKFLCYPAVLDSLSLILIYTVSFRPVLIISYHLHYIYEVMPLVFRKSSCTHS